jgi:hypothetical protein
MWLPTGGGEDAKVVVEVLGLRGEISGTVGGLGRGGDFGVGGWFRGRVEMVTVRENANGRCYGRWEKDMIIHTTSSSDLTIVSHLKTIYRKCSRTRRPESPHRHLGYILRRWLLCIA